MLWFHRFARTATFAILTRHTHKSRQPIRYRTAAMRCLTSLQGAMRGHDQPAYGGRQPGARVDESYVYRSASHGADEAQLGARDANTVDHLSVALELIHRRKHELTASMRVHVLLSVDRQAIGADEPDLVVQHVIQHRDVAGQQRAL